MMNNFKYFLYFKKNKALSIYVRILFVIVLGLFLLSSIFNYSNYYVSILKKNLSYRIINVYDMENIEKIEKEEYVEQVVYSSYLSFDYNNDNYFGYNFDLLNENYILDDNEVVIQKSQSEKFNIKINEEMTFTIHNTNLIFKVTDIIPDIIGMENIVFVSDNIISAYSLFDMKNVYIVLDNFDSYIKLQSDYPDLNISLYQTSLEENLNKYNAISKILSYIKIILLIFLFFIFILIINKIISEEKRDIGIYRTVGFNIIDITVIYILKLFIIDVYVFLCSLIILILFFSLFNLLSVLSLVDLISFFIISLVIVIIIPFSKFLLVKKEKIVNLLK